MTVSEKDILSSIIKFQGEYSRAHFELVSTYLFDAQNSILKDLDCNLLLSYLILKSFQSIKEKNVQYSYNDLLNISELEPLILKKSEIAEVLDYPRETVRRNINKLIDHDLITVDKKNIIVKPNNCLSDIKTTIYENSLKKCLAVIFKNLNLQIKYEKKLDANSINLKNSFSLIWCNFLEMIVSISIIWKKHHSNLGCWYLAGTCALNQMYNTKDFKFDLNSENYTENFFLNLTGKKNNRGLNPTTLSELTGIPRETVIRYLAILIKNKTLTKNKQNLYFLTTNIVKEKNLIKNLERVHLKVSELCFEMIKVIS